MLAALWPAAAFAHASFVRSEPPDLCGPLAAPRLPPNDPRCQTGVVLQEPPGSVRLSFSEPVQLIGRGLRVLSPAGRPVQRGKPAVEGEQVSVEIDAGEPGTYVVDWQVVSSDTHPARGRFAFSVGQPSATATAGGVEVGQVTPLGLALQALGRWLHFAGYALAFGTLAVTFLAGAGAIPGQWRLTNAGIVLLLAAELPALLGQTASLGLDQTFDGDAIGDALASPFGRLLAFRVAAALLLWVAGGSLEGAWVGGRTTANQFDRATVRPDVRLAAGTALALGVILALIDGFGQHAASFQPLALGLLVHAVHLISMAVWLGGLAVAIMAPADRKIGRSMTISLAGIAASGLAMALVHLSAPGELASTAYGQALLGKQIPVLLALALGWLAAKRLGLWRAEAGALVAVIGLAGLLVSLPPPR